MKSTFNDSKTQRFVGLEDKVTKSRTHQQYVLHEQKTTELCFLGDFLGWWLWKSRQAGLSLRLGCTEVILPAGNHRYGGGVRCFAEGITPKWLTMRTGPKAADRAPMTTRRHITAKAVCHSDWWVQRRPAPSVHGLLQSMDKICPLQYLHTDQSHGKVCLHSFFVL